MIPGTEAGTWAVVGNPKDVRKGNYKPEDLKRFQNDLEKEPGEGGFETNLDVADHVRWGIRRWLGNAVDRDDALFDVYLNDFNQNNDLFVDFLEELLLDQGIGDRRFNADGLNATGVRNAAKAYFARAKGYIRDNAQTQPQIPSYQQLAEERVNRDKAGTY